MTGGTAVISIDTERMWGYADLFAEPEFERRFAGSIEIHDRLLDLLCAARITATWAVVGGLSLAEDRPDLRGLPAAWRRAIPAGDERSAPLWYARSFVLRLRDAGWPQEIGLHGGLMHLPWRKLPRDTARQELRLGVQALREIGIEPRSFVYPRDLVEWRDELAPAGIACYRGRAPILSERFGYSRVGSAIRAAEELAAVVPPAVRVTEDLPGLWNLPASMPLYSMTRARNRLVPLRLRAARVRLGLEAAARSGGIFHLCLHPENLAQSPEALPAFEEIVHEIQRWRDRGDGSSLSMSQAVDCAAPVGAV
jgi:peptidoglycan/xylan/chitin deacetylase (PgdA/CDA1 family)